MTIQSEPNVEIISVHVPKTAGTTFKTILLDIYQPENIVFDYPKTPLLSEKVLTLPSNIRLIHGHFPVTKYNNYFPQAHRIAWLREPIDRLISLYVFATIHFAKRKIESNWNKEKELLLEFASRSGNCNGMSYYLEGMELKDFFFIGLQEFFFIDLQILKEKLVWEAFHISNYTKPLNTSPYSDYHDFKQHILSDKYIIDNLRLLNAKDIEIYQDALELKEKSKNKVHYNEILPEQDKRLQNQPKQNKHTKQIGNSAKYELEFQELNTTKFITILIKLNTTKQQINNLCRFSFAPIRQILEKKFKLSGWIVGLTSPVMQIQLFRDEDDNLWQTVTPNIHRPLIAQKFASLPGSQFSGFEFQINLDDVSKLLKVKAILQDGNQCKLATIELSSNVDKTNLLSLKNKELRAIKNKLTKEFTQVSNQEKKLQDNTLNKYNKSSKMNRVTNKVNLNKLPKNINDLLKFSLDPIDAVLTDHIKISGWVLGVNSPVVSVDLLRNGQRWKSQSPHIKRPLVAKNFASLTGSQSSGFSFNLDLDNDLKSIELVIILQDNTKINLATIEILTGNFFIPDKKTFFIHVGKTAGSSFNKFLQNNLLGEDHCERYLQRDQPFLLNELEKLKNFDFISGHLQLSYFNQNFLREDYFLVTILRNPLTQTISHLNWIAHIHNSDHNSPFYINHPQAVKEMAKELCQKELNDVSEVIEFLKKYEMFKNHQSRYFQTNCNSELSSTEIINNLRSFDLVGLTENYSQFINEYISLIGGEGIVSPSLDKVNVNTSPTLDSTKLMSDKSFIDFLNEYNTIDIEVYNYFKKK